MEYYRNDLPTTESLTTLEQADTILATTLHGRDWTTRANADRQACLDNPDRTPEREDDRAALRDASAVLSSLPWRGLKADSAQPLAFPRNLTTEQGQRLNGTPVAIQTATSALAAHLRQQADLPISPAIIASYAIGESRGTFREPSRDILPDHVRRLIAPMLNAGATWAPLRA